MNPVSRYILSVTAAAMIAAVLQSLAGKGSTGQLVKLLVGVFMAMTVMALLVELEIPDLQGWYSDFSAEGTAAAAMGEKMAEDTSGAIIKERLEAYILDKAAMYQADVTADVTLDETGVPVSVSLTGQLSPYAKGRLTQMIASDLGVGEEALQWIS